MKNSLLYDLSRGKISLQEATAQHKMETEFNEQEFNETFSEIAPFAASIFISETAVEATVDAINEAMSEAQDYLIGQGLMNENFVIPTNPKQNIMRLNRVSAIERLTRVFILANARKTKNVNYKRYKVGMAMKKTAMAAMDKMFRPKAARQAVMAWNNLQKHNRMKKAQPAAKK